MTVRTIKVYYLPKSGYGCLSKDLEITTENFVDENDDTIIVWESDLDAWGGTQEIEVVYCKNLDIFIKRENERFARQMRELTERHQKTLRMAGEHKSKSLTNSKSKII